MATWTRRWIVMAICLFIALGVPLLGTVPDPPSPPAAQVHLDGSTSFLEWSTRLANRVTLQITDRLLPGGPVVLTTDRSNAAVAGMLWTVVAGALVVALRQLIKWGRERVPGPIELRAITVAQKDSNDASAALTDVMRDHLTRAGVLPNPFRSGDVLVDVTAALGATGDAGRLTKLIDAVRGALTVKTGYVVNGVADVEPADKSQPCRLILHIDDAATGQTIGPITTKGTNHRECAVQAAYDVLESLYRREATDRRTSPRQRWTSPASMRSYFDGVQNVRDRQYELAMRALDDASDQEPANTLIQLERANGELEWAKDLLVGAGTPEAKTKARAHYFNSLQSSLRAVALDPRWYRTHHRLALVLSYAGDWADGWKRVPRSLRDDVCRLLRVIGNTTASSDLASTDDPEKVRRIGLELAAHHWDTAATLARRREIIRQAWHLNMRRQFSVEVWPLRRRRTSRRDQFLAGAVASRYDLRLAYGESPVDPKDLEAQLKRLHRGSWYSLRRHKSLESSVLYNVAAGYARRAVMNAEEGEPDPVSVAEAISCLSDTYSGAGEQLSGTEIRYIAADPHFRELLITEAFRDWISRYLSPDDLARWPRVSAPTSPIRKRATKVKL